jgi:hypothetical protein
MMNQGSIQELVFGVNMKEHPVALEYGYVDFLLSLFPLFDASLVE